MDGLGDLGSLFGSSGGGGSILSLLGLGGGGGATAASPTWMQALLGGLFGSGEISNLLESVKQQSYQNKLLSLINNPAALTKMINEAVQPLNSGLVQTLNNNVQGNLASRGLAQAPGIFAASETQAQAPYLQQNYGTAEQQVLASLGLPAGTFTQPQNMTPALMAFLRSFGTPGAAGTGGAGGVGPATSPSLDQLSPSGLLADPTLDNSGLAWS